MSEFYTRKKTKYLAKLFTEERSLRFKQFDFLLIYVSQKNRNLRKVHFQSYCISHKSLLSTYYLSCIIYYLSYLEMVLQNFLSNRLLKIINKTIFVKNFNLDFIKTSKYNFYKAVLNGFDEFFIFD